MHRLHGKFQSACKTIERRRVLQIVCTGDRLLVKRGVKLITECRGKPFESDDGIEIGTEGS